MATDADTVSTPKPRRTSPARGIRRPATPSTRSRTIETDSDGAGVEQAFTIEAIGIGMDPLEDGLDVLDQVEGQPAGPPHVAINVTSAEDSPRSARSAAARRFRPRPATTSSTAPPATTSSSATCRSPTRWPRRMRSPRWCRAPAGRCSRSWSRCPGRRKRPADPAGDGADWTRADTVAYIHGELAALWAEVPPQRRQ